MADANTPPRDPREISWPYEHRLSKPVPAHDDTIQVLVLREPTGEDVLDFGLLDGLDSGQFYPLVSRLAAVPLSTLKKAPASDLISLATVLSRFFVWAAQPPFPSTTPSA